MIPILYNKNETDFIHNGIGFLSDIITASVLEERNGEYELTFQYPLTGRFYDELSEGAIIKAKANETSAPQLFRIYKSSKPLGGYITYNAEHISYDLNGLPSTGWSVKNATPQTAINKAFESAGLPCAFTCISDISTLNSTEIKEPCSLRALLGGQRGSALDTWGGEFEFDNFTVKLHAHRGADRGVSIVYGKNLKDLNQEANIADCYTHILPFVKYQNTANEEIYLYLPEKLIPITNAENVGHNKVFILDLSEKFSDGESKTEEALRSKALSYINANNLGSLKINIKVSFVQLWQTEEYKNIAPLERVCLCDTVEVRFSALGVKTKAKVIKTEYDCLNERYISITLGDSKSSFADTINKQTAELSELKGNVKTGFANATKELSEAIANATALITGHKGGYVILHPAESPQEILILDKPNIDEAVNVWRWNSAGLGFSKTGYNGNYDLAITMDGTIVADFIRAGVINGALIKADSIQSTAISQSYKTEVKNEIGNTAQSLEQAFSAADEQLLSLIKSVQTVVNGNAETLETRISELRQTIDGLNLKFTDKTSGGINYVQNSSALGGLSDDWETDGSITAMREGEALDKTTAKAMFRVREGHLTQKITVQSGSPYTLTFKAKCDTSNICTVSIKNGEETLKALDTITETDWTEYTLTFTATDSEVIFTASCTGDSLYIADIMLAEGSDKRYWTPAPNEIYTTNVKVDRKGINISNSESQTETIIDNTQFAVKHENKTVLTVNKDRTELQKTDIVKELTIGDKGRFVPRSDGVDFVLLD
ncbi:MAG: phage tail spike protein [Candidatus Fimenecus sp.]